MKVIDLLVFFEIFPRFLKNAYLIKCQTILKMFFFVRVTVHNMSHGRKIKKVVYYVRVFDALLTVLSKAFDLYSA